MLIKGLREAVSKPAGGEDGLRAHLGSAPKLGVHKWAACRLR